MVGRAFFMCLFLWVGYGVRLSKDFKMPPINFDIHTVGYIIIAMVYLTFVFIK